MAGCVGSTKEQLKNIRELSVQTAPPDGAVHRPQSSCGSGFGLWCINFFLWDEWENLSNYEKQYHWREPKGVVGLF